jgi:mono/diheme cytochrome c family protein
VRAAALLAAGGLLLAGCSDGAPRSPSAERGRQVYVAQCGACHHPSDPARPGALAPEIAGVPRAVLEAKILRGDYPDGYRPKRPTRIMPPMPALGPELGPLADFLGAPAS